MKYTSQINFQRDQIPTYTNVSEEANDEYIFKECIIKLIKDIPLDHLKEIFHCNKMDPDKDIPEHLKNPLEKINMDYIHYLRHLQQDKIIRYEVFIDIYKLM
jgi:hypothetical protein